MVICCNGLAPNFINSSVPEQNVRHFADGIFRCIFMNEKFFILIKISLKSVPNGPNNNNSALVKIMAWRRIGDKPLSEPMWTRLIDAYIIKFPDFRLYRAIYHEPHLDAFDVNVLVTEFLLHINKGHIYPWYHCSWILWLWYCHSCSNNGKRLLWYITSTTAVF